MKPSSKISDALVASIEVPPGRREVLLFDSALPGFGVRVTAKGGRTFLLQYKVNGRSRRVVLGTFGELTAHQARKKAEVMRGRIREGHDPAAERDARRAAAKAKAAEDAFTCERLLEAWAAIGLAENKPSYREGAVAAARRVLGPEVLAAPAASLTKAQCVAILDRAMAERGPIMANRARAYLRAAWAWAMRRGSIATNPWAEVPRVVSEKGRARERFLADWECRLAWLAAERLGEPWCAFFRVLLATGQRRGEVAGMTWEELDLASGTWRLPAARTKNGRDHTVPLAPAVVEMLAARPRLANSPYVFWGPRGSAVSGWHKPAERLRAEMQQIEEAEAAEEGREARMIAPFVIHDLRRTTATGLQRLGVRLEVIEAVLNHISGARGGIVGIYQRHGFEAEKRHALERWCEHLLALAAGRAVAGGAVVTLRRA